MQERPALDSLPIASGPAMLDTFFNAMPSLPYGREGVGEKIRLDSLHIIGSAGTVIPCLQAFPP